jgi:hypothetical protein
MSVAHSRFGDTLHQCALLRHGSRRELIAWLPWNDANGVWTDEDSAAAGMRPMSLREARTSMRKALAESRIPGGPSL